jgi:predicted transcriptional regulator
MPNFHLPLDTHLYQQLKEAAERCKKPSTVLAREAIEVFLAQLKKQALFDDIQQYAQAMAGTEDDLDPDIEASSIEHLNQTDG